MAQHHDMNPPADALGPRRPTIGVDNGTVRRPTPDYLTRLENCLETAFLLAFSACENRGRQ